MDPAPLILGIDPCARYRLDDTRDYQSSERIGCTTKSSVLLAWPSSAEKNSSLFVATGQEDGQCFIFSERISLVSSSVPPSSQASQFVGPSEKTPVSASSSPKFTRAPSPTPSGISKASSYLRIHGQAPSMVPPRSAPTLALPAKAQVEAPKSHVNYDEEPDHLRTILKTNRTDKTFNSDRFTSSSGSTSPSVAIDDPFSKEPRAPRLTSAEETLPSNITTINEPTKRDGPTLRLQLKICPPRIGYGHSITALKLLDGNTILACLQQCGSLSLFSVQDGRCLASVRVDDLPAINPPSERTPVPDIPPYCIWKGLRVAQDGQSTLLFLSGQVDPFSSDSSFKAEDGKAPGNLRLCVLRVLSPHERAFVTSPEDILEKVGDWMTDGSANSFGLHIDDKGNLALYHVNSALHLIFQTIHFLPFPPSPCPTPGQTRSANASSSFLPLPISQSIGQLQQLKIPNPFKSSPARTSSRYLTVRSAPSKIRAVERLDTGRIELGDEFDVGSLNEGQAFGLSDVGGVSLATFSGVVNGALWTDDQCIIFHLGTKQDPLRVAASVESDGTRNVSWLDRSRCAVSSMDDVAVVVLKAVDANGEDLSSQDTPLTGLFKADIGSRLMQSGIVVSTLLSPSLLLVATFAENAFGISAVSLPRLSSKDGSTGARSTRRSTMSNRSLWPSEVTGRSDSDDNITSILPIGNSTILLGLATGNVVLQTLSDMILLQDDIRSPSLRSKAGLQCSVLSLHQTRNVRTGDRYIIGSALDGSLAVWNWSDLKLLARWTLFATPLRAIIDLSDEEHVGKLKGCLLCVAEHGTIVVILIDGLEVQFTVPGSSAALERICLGENNLLLFYNNDKVRLWDLSTQEFWRSMTKLKAEELLAQGGWFEAHVELDGPQFHSDKAPFGVLRNSTELFIDIRQLISTGTRPVTEPPKDPEKQLLHTDSSAVAKTWSNLRPVLASFLCFSAGTDYDDLRTGLLGHLPHGLIPAWSVVGVKAASSKPSKDVVWKITPEYTAIALLAVLALLRATSAFEEWDSMATQLSTYLVSSLHEDVGEGYKPPSLSTLAKYWFDPCPEIKLAARTLFSACVQRFSDDEASQIIEEWRIQLPSIQPESLKDCSYAATSLLISGQIASEHYASLPTETLIDISKSVALYLHDESSPHRILAIELCSSGFHVWQHYVDSVNALRALFDLATGSQSEGVQARAAVLQIATSNTPLFMTTLSMDIANPGSVERKKSVMQLIAYLIKKKPLVLYPNLTRLVEAVVKSLDPSSAHGREAVLDPAIEILGHVVRTFPSVDFHKDTQRLALGTPEGAVIVYDLKTATRLYVLEGHKRRLAAISFSPDGRRLVTASLDESVVMVWKVGSSLSSFFRPGAPPGGSEAFKVLPFNVGDEARMTVASTLDWVTFEWPNDRTARLKIRDSVLTFNT